MEQRLRTTPPETRFTGKAAGKREQSGAGTGYAEQKQARRFSDKAAGKREQSGAGTGYAEQKQARPVFRGNGLSRTAMLFKIATVAGHKLTVPEMNKFKNVNPRSLERVYDEVLRIGDAGNAMFALRLLLG